VRKWLPALPILVGVAVSAAVYGRLPAEVLPDWSRIVPMDGVVDPMPRLAAAWLMPTIAVLLWAAMVAGARVRGKHGGAFLSDRTDATAIARFEGTYAVVVTGVVGLVILMHLAMLGAAVGWPAWTASAFGVLLGAGIAATGNLMPRVRPNWIVGIRTRATLSDPEFWLRTHRYFGGLLMIGGVVVAIVAIVASRYAFVAGILSILLAAALSHWFARPKRHPVVAI
jgi:uncharacterized membrane protein